MECAHCHAQLAPDASALGLLPVGTAVHLVGRQSREAGAYGCVLAEHPTPSRRKHSPFKLHCAMCRASVGNACRLLPSDCPPVFCFAWGDVLLGAEEEGCGRPLGLAFGEDGVLWVADAWAGILNVFPNKTIVSVLNAIDGERLRFANGIAVDHRTGVVIVRYDPRDRSTRVLAQDLPCPNGLALTPSSEALVVALTAQMSLARLWVSGPRAGELEAPLGGAALPGFLDNVALSPRGTFWAGASRPAKPLILAVIRRPAVRRLLAVLPIGLIQAVVKDHAMLWEVTEDGDIVRVLEDASGTVVGNAGALEYEDGSLLLESFCSPTLRLLKRA
eukprot:m51a1_g5833 hypothetical protein (332) ;mRNA; r:274500-280324